MKYRFFSFILLSFLCFLLCSCNNKEYKLVELNSNEVIETLSNENDLALAVINDTDLNKDKYLKDLDKLAKKTKQNIYYVNFNHMTFELEMLLLDGYGVNIDSLTFTTFINGNMDKTVSYDNYQTLKNAIGTNRFRDEVNMTNQETIDKLINSAREKYKNGYISTAYDDLDKIWNSNEAKEEFNNNSYYNIVKEWENFEQLDNNEVRCNLIAIYPFSNDLYTASKVGDFEKFEYPNMKEYDSKYYKVLNDIILVSDKEDGKYVQYAKIKHLSYDKLVLEKNNKEYVYLIMGE